MPVYGKIGRRLLVWFGLMAVVPLSVVGLQGYRLTREALMQAVFQRMEAVAVYKRAQVELWFGERRRSLTALSDAVGMLTAEKRAAELVVASLRAWLRGGDFDRVGLFDSEGRLRYFALDPAWSGDADPGMQRRWLWEVDSLLNTTAGEGMRFSATGYDPGRGTYLTVVMPLFRRTAAETAGGWLAARLLVSRSLDGLLMDTVGLGRSGQSYLVDCNRTMLTRSRFLDHPAPGTHKMRTAAVDSTLAGRSWTGVYTGWEGAPALGACQPVAGVGWGLITEMSREEATAPLAMLRRNWLLVTLLTVAGVLLAAALLSRSLSHPIHRLAEASGQVSAGDLDVRVDFTGRDEVGHLAESFNLMVERLQESRRSLEASYRELVEKERLLVQSEKLAAVGELVAAVVHELRNPLSAVKMNLKLVSRRVSSDDPAAEHLNLALEQAQRLETMLNQLLDHTKPVSLNLTRTAPDKLLTDALAPYNDRIAAEGVVVDTSIAAEVGTLKVDAGLMQQALTNLIANALDAMRESEERRLELSLAAHPEDPSVLRITVADSGSGIPAETAGRIFEPFFTTRGDGTGLGLANVRKIVELHRGRIRFEPHPGGGTVFILELPKHLDADEDTAG